MMSTCLPKRIHVNLTATAKWLLVAKEEAVPGSEPISFSVTNVIGGFVFLLICRPAVARRNMPDIIVDAATWQVGGVLRYVLEGNIVNIPLAKDSIMVHPKVFEVCLSRLMIKKMLRYMASDMHMSIRAQPSLTLKYFLERVVYSDDPFTPEIEPAVPYFLGLLIINDGRQLHSGAHILGERCCSSCFMLVLAVHPNRPLALQALVWHKMYRLRAPSRR